MIETPNTIEENTLSETFLVTPTLVEPVVQVLVPDVVDELPLKYSFLDEKILSNTEKLQLYDSGIQHIKNTYSNFDKLALTSAGFVLAKMMILEKISEENLISEIDNYMLNLNISYLNYISGLLSSPISGNVIRMSKSEKLRKFSNNYLYEKGYGEEVYEIQTSDGNVQMS